MSKQGPKRGPLTKITDYFCLKGIIGLKRKTTNAPEASSIKKPQGHEPELEADVHAVGPFVAGQLDEAFLVLEGDRNCHEVRGATSHDAAHVLCRDMRRR